MKNIILTALFLLPFVMISCQKEAINNSENAIRVTAQDASNETLKTALINSTVNWIANADHIGLYSNRAYTTAPGVYAANVDYIAQSTGAASTFSSTTTVYFHDNSPHHFYAYYPYKSGTHPLTAVPVSLPAAQTQVAATTTHIGPLDFEVATPLALTSGTGPGGTNPLVAFTFNHVFTILKFDLTCEKNRTLSSISLTTSAAPNISLNTGSTIDIAQAAPAAGVPYTLSPAAGGTPLNVTLAANLPLSGTVSSAYMLILPGNATGNTFTIVFTSANHKTYQVTKAGINFERGKIYTITQAIPTGPGEW